MIAVARRPVRRLLFRPGEITGLLLAISAICMLRTAIGAPAAAASESAAVAAAACLLAVAWSAGWRPSRLRPLGITVGTITGVVLAVLPHLQPGGRAWGAVWAQPTQPLMIWTVTVMAIAVSEELVLRGCLLHAVARRRGTVAAVVVAALAFAAIHVPLYGWRVLPVDFGVGVMLGCLRVELGLGAAISAHLIADLATGWLR